MVARPPRGLVALTPGRARGEAEVAPLLARIGTALEAGLPALLLREPGLDDRAFLRLAQGAREIAAQAWLGVHDRLHVARAAGADGLHLGFRSLEPRRARELVGDELALGFSAHAGDAEATWEGSDYLFFGPLHDTPSKRELLEPVGLAGIEAAVARAGRPLLALGGVTPADVAPVLQRGATGVAVLSGVLLADDVGAAVAAYLAALDGAGAGR